MTAKMAMVLSSSALTLTGTDPARADLSQPGPHQTGYSTATITRPNNSTFRAILFYPAWRIPETG